MVVRKVLETVASFLRVTDRHKEELGNEPEVSFAMEMNDKSSLPSELKEH